MPTINDVTLGISCKGNIRALCLSLSAALTGTFQFSAIQIRLEGQFPCINDFYFAQLTDLARMKGIDTKVTVANSKGVRESRNWQIDNCKTTWLWMLDDDAVPDSRCLEAYSKCLLSNLDDVTEGRVTFLAGSKCDVNNRRNYPFFDMTAQVLDVTNTEANHSLVYDVEKNWGVCNKTKALDTGNCVLCIPVLRKNNCRFTHFDEHRNSSGDATTFWLNLDSLGLSGFFVPSAVAYHLEKPGGGFNEFEARAEMLLRACELKGWSKETLKAYFMMSTWK
jgi:hypothetical protein